MKDIFANVWENLSQRTLCELAMVFGALIPLPEKKPRSRRRIFTQERTFWLFLAQVFSFSQSCDEMVRKAQGWLAMGPQIAKMISSNNSAYCQARSRLDQCYLKIINKNIIQHVQSQISPKYLWLRRHVKVVDGTSLSMPDTAENQRSYPQSKSQKKGCGFPTMNWVAMFSLATGVLLASRIGEKGIHERTLWRSMWCLLKTGDVVLADRGFCAMADFCMLSKLGVDCVMRLHQKRKLDVGIIERFNKNDYLVEWKKEKKRPKWISKKNWKAISDSITVRYVTVSMENPGFRTTTVTLATTLLDPKLYPMVELSNLYSRRWLAEVYLRHIKISMGMDVLRCKTPELIFKEFLIFNIAYNLIRSLIWDASIRNGTDPLQVSFKGTMQALVQWAPIFTTVTDEKKRVAMEYFFEVIASKCNRIRLRKRQPRALKRRGKNFQLLTAPRNEFLEIQHRHKYRKAS